MSLSLSGRAVEVWLSDGAERTGSMPEFSSYQPTELCNRILRIILFFSAGIIAEA